MTMTPLRGWPPLHPFPESQRDSTGSNAPDFPGSSGGREQGKFRASGEPLLTTVAVVGDDGQPVGMTTDERLDEVILYQRAMLIALGMLVDRSVDELLDEAIRNT